MHHACQMRPALLARTTWAVLRILPHTRATFCQNKIYRHVKYNRCRVNCCTDRLIVKNRSLSGFPFETKTPTNKQDPGETTSPDPRGHPTLQCMLKLSSTFHREGGEQVPPAGMDPPTALSTTSGSIRQGFCIASTQHKADAKLASPQRTPQGELIEPSCENRSGGQP